MANIAIWGGGPYHPTLAQADWLIGALEDRGWTGEYWSAREGLAVRAERSDVLVVSRLEWSGMGSLDPKLWEEPESTPHPYSPLSDEELDALKAHLASGGGLLCLHSAIASYDERSELEEIFDGRWVWGWSTNSKYEEFDVSVVGGEHPIVAGVSDFRITDELYYNLNGPTNSEVLLEASYDGRTWPLAWAGAHSGGKTAYIGLGHDMAAFANPSLQRLLLNAVEWLAPA